MGPWVTAPGEAARSRGACNAGEVGRIDGMPATPKAASRADRPSPQLHAQTPARPGRLQQAMAQSGRCSVARGAAARGPAAETPGAPATAPSHAAAAAHGAPAPVSRIPSSAAASLRMGGMIAPAGGAKFDIVGVHHVRRQPRSGRQRAAGRP